jgi:hypothetical protein
VEAHGIVRLIVQGQGQEIEPDNTDEALCQVMEQGGEIPVERDGLGDIQQRAVLFDVRLENGFDNSILAGAGDAAWPTARH